MDDITDSMDKSLGKLRVPENLSERRRVMDYLNGFDGVTAEEVQ